MAMMNGSGGSGRPPPDDGEESPFGAGAADAVAGLDDGDLMLLGGSVLSELVERGLLRVLLRNRTDAATAFEVEAIRRDEDGFDLVADGYHAETPEGYAGWVAEAAVLQERLGQAGLSETEADAALATASDEALLLTLESAQVAEDDEEDPGETADALPPRDSGASSMGARIAVELLRRGVIEAEAED